MSSSCNGIALCRLAASIYGLHGSIFVMLLLDSWMWVVSLRTLVQGTVFLAPWSRVFWHLFFC